MDWAVSLCLPDLEPFPRMVAAHLFPAGPRTLSPIFRPRLAFYCLHCHLAALLPQRAVHLYGPHPSHHALLLAFLGRSDARAIVRPHRTGSWLSVPLSDALHGG